MSDAVRWGILSTGDIAHQFASDLRHVEGAELTSVASRSLEKADRFGDEFGIPCRYGSYEDLAASDGVDMIYIGTPHPLHEANALLCLEEGKAVLCEKPLALNAAQARRMIKTAQSRGLFLMEAMWTYFFPAMQQVRTWLREGAIGEVQMVRADFCFHINFDPEFRLFSPRLGGGALLDVGVYALALADLAFGGPPSALQSTAVLGETGVDERASISLTYPGGGVASLTCASRTAMPEEAVIAGSKGWIRLPARFSQPDVVVLEREGQCENLRFDRQGYGYVYEAKHAVQCLQAGLTESPEAPLMQSLARMETMDRIRAQWGLHYPDETPS